MLRDVPHLRLCLYNCMMKFSEKQNDFHSSWDVKKKMEPAESSGYGYLLVAKHHWEYTIHADSYMQQFKCTIQMHGTLEFKDPAIQIHNTCKFKYQAIQIHSTYRFKTGENIYYQVPVYKNRGGCCDSHYPHRW